jgi:hypothetical protein
VGGEARDVFRVRVGLTGTEQVEAKELEGGGGRGKGRDTLGNGGENEAGEGVGERVVVGAISADGAAGKGGSPKSGGSVDTVGEDFKDRGKASRAEGWGAQDGVVFLLAHGE